MQIFEGSNSIVSDVVNRILNSRELQELYVYGNKFLLRDIYSTIQIKEWNEWIDEEGIAIYAQIDSQDILTQFQKWIPIYRRKNDFIIYVPSEERAIIKELACFGVPYPLSAFSALDGYLFLIGVTFDKKDLSVPENFKVLTIMHFYNEVDILEQTICYLLEQELDIYLLDNWSDDGSYEVALKYKNRYPDRIYVEQFPLTGRTDNFELYNQLRRTEELAQSMEYEWFIHYDADEIRVAPWEDVTLRTALYWIDRLGYNCVENNVIDFRVTGVEQTNIFAQNTYFDFRHVFKWFNHLKTWKKTNYLDLKSTGGHSVKIKNPKVFPLKILNKHYPIRSVEHGYKKVMKDRVPRFVKECKERGWHRHYNHIRGSEEMIYNPNELLYWSDTTRIDLFIPLFMELGLRWDEETETCSVPNIQDKNLVVYGAGNIGKKIIGQLAKRNHIVAWIDSAYDVTPWMYGLGIESIRVLDNIQFDYVVIAVVRDELKKEIRCVLNERIADEKLIWIEKK